jgi:Binding-protein-dependent transport system inner membrane component/IclR helix-turn-helix domain
LALSKPTFAHEYNAQSLERGLFVLAHLRDSPQAELSLADIATGLGLDKSTVHLLLTTLVRHGYAAQDPATKRYRLGLALLSFGHRVVERLDVRRHALRVMRALAEETGETVHLNVLAGAGALCVEEVVGPNGATLGSNVGVVLPLHSVATGKCFLTWCSGAFFIFLCRQFFRTLPYELDEAAKVDGASPLTIYTRIILPLPVPVLVSIVIFSFNWVWGDFLHPLIYLNDRDKLTLAVGLNSMIGMYATAWNLLMACAFITSIPVIVVFFAGQKYFVRGVALSGLADR